MFHRALCLFVLIALPSLAAPHPPPNSWKPKAPKAQPRVADAFHCSPRTKESLPVAGPPCRNMVDLLLPPSGQVEVGYGGSPGVGRDVDVTVLPPPKDGHPHLGVRVSSKGFFTARINNAYVPASCQPQDPENYSILVEFPRNTAKTSPVPLRLQLTMTAPGPASPYETHVEVQYVRFEYEEPFRFDLPTPAIFH